MFPMSPIVCLTGVIAEIDIISRTVIYSRACCYRSSTYSLKKIALSTYLSQHYKAVLPDSGNQHLCCIHNCCNSEFRINFRCDSIHITNCPCPTTVSTEPECIHKHLPLGDSRSSIQYSSLFRMNIRIRHRSMHHFRITTKRTTTKLAFINGWNSTTSHRQSISDRKHQLCHPQQLQLLSC